MNTQNVELLKEMSQSYIKMGYFNPRIKQILEQSETKAEGVSKMLEYVSKCQKASIVDGRATMSMNDMKNQIFKMIGHEEAYRSTAPITKDEMTVIYSFIIQLPSEYFLEDTNEEIK